MWTSWNASPDTSLILNVPQCNSTSIVYRIQNTEYIWRTKTQMIVASAQAEPIANLANQEANRNRGRDSRCEGDGWGHNGAMA